MNELLEKLLKESEEATQFPEGVPFKPNVLIQYPTALQIAENSSQHDESNSLGREYRKKP